jgi:hypothetical protein
MSVKLREVHRQLIIESLQLIADYKFCALRKSSWATFESEYLTSAVEQIDLNAFKVNNPKSNYFLWHLDQLCWSRRLMDGVKPSEGVPLIDTRLGEQVAEICRVAARGQAFYDRYYQGNEFHNLFDQ